MFSSSISPEALPLSLVEAWRQFSAGQFTVSLAASRELASSEGPQREQALTLSARSLMALGRHQDIVAMLTVELPTFRGLHARLETEALLARAHAALNDFGSADAIISQFNSEEALAAPPTTRAELRYAEALIAWMKGDLPKAEAALAHSDDVSTYVRGRRVILESWIASKRERFDDHARLMLEGAQIIQSSETVDIGLLAGAIRAICSIAREIYAPGLLRNATEFYEQLDWPEDLSVDQFMAARMLGWATALQGTDRYLESLRLLHRASALAPTPAWQVWALLDRAAMKRYGGELASSSADLYEALDLVHKVRWAETSDDERIGLLYAAELVASLDIGEASKLLAQFSQIGESFSPRMAVRGDRRLEAGKAYSTGVVQQAVGDSRKAKHFFESAYFVYDEIGYKWRAARTALHLYQVTQDQAWHDAAKQQIRDYPQSWIASDVREASTGIGDDGWNRLTPRQREVFNALCEGLTAKKIGERLDCSPNTVRNHIHWIYQAFRVQSQPELITEARKRKLIS
jgi:DNA-binding CsgD family transcriptional regulator/tetratricopeptide (TPR) repeat protein